MAIYNNREVTVIGPNSMANSVDSINIQYKDGTHENVALARVKFTEDEKKDLIKRYPSKYDNIDTVKEEDLKAVRVGVAPAYDPSYQQAAEQKVIAEKQAELNKQNLEAAKKNAEKNVDEGKLTVDQNPNQVRAVDLGRDPRTNQVQPQTGPKAK